MRIKQLCIHCGWNSIMNQNVKCPACGSELMRPNFLLGHKFCDMTDEQIQKYVEEKITHDKMNPDCLAMRKEYQIQQRIKWDEEKREQRRQREATNLAYMNKYFEFVHEAEAQGIPKSEAENIASYAMQHGMPSLPKCPTCGSVDVTKISAGTKVAKTAVFGVFGAMSDAGKSWKCRKCGCKW